MVIGPENWSTGGLSNQDHASSYIFMVRTTTCITSNRDSRPCVGCTPDVNLRERHKVCQNAAVQPQARPAEQLAGNDELGL